MAHRILPVAVERYEIHSAVCRARRQNLSCSLCSDLYERAVCAWNRYVETLQEAA
jgi:hypothetical protein